MSFVICFLQGVVKNLIFCIYFRRHTWWVNASSFITKMQKINRHLLGKNSKFKNVFTNANDNHKNRRHSKIVFGHAVGRLLSELNIYLKQSLLLNNSICWEWLLLDQIKARGKYMQLMKIWITADCYFMKIYKMMFSCRLHLKLCFRKVTYSLEFLQQFLVA